MHWQVAFTYALLAVAIAGIAITAVANRRLNRECGRMVEQVRDLRDQLATVGRRTDRRNSGRLTVDIEGASNGWPLSGGATIHATAAAPEAKRYRTTFANLRTLGHIPDRYMYADPFAAVLSGSRINHAAIARAVADLEAAEAVRRGEAIRQQRDIARDTDQPA